MSIEQLLAAFSEQSARARTRYHLTLGGLIAALKGVAPDCEVTTDDGQSVGVFRSYRGYYDDLAVSADTIPTIAADLLARAQEALGAKFEGYKGGEFTMVENTPLWFAEYGCCGKAIIGAETRDGELVLVTKDLDE